MKLVNPLLLPQAFLRRVDLGDEALLESPTGFCAAVKLVRLQLGQHLFQQIIGVHALILALLFTVPAVAQDTIDLKSAQIVNAPRDVADWPITASISSVTVGPQGVNVQSNQTWPNSIPPGWQGPIQYTVWGCVQVPNWTCSAFVAMWQGRDWTGAAFLRNDDWAANWADVRYGPMHVSLKAGDVIALFLTAGMERFASGPSSVRERSNVVTIQVPANDSGTFTFNAVPSPPAPIPTGPPPTPPSTPPITPTLDLSSVIARLDQILAKQDQQTTQILAAVNEPAFLKKLFSNPYFQAVLASAGTWAITHQVMK